MSSKRVLLIVLGILLLGALAWYFLPVPKVSVSDVKKVVAIQQAKPVIYKDKTGASHTEKPVITSPDPNVIKAMYQHRLDSLSALYAISQNEVHAFGDANVVLQGRITALLSKPDSNGRQEFDWSDKHLILNGDIDKNTIAINYKYSDTLNYIFYDKHRGFIKKLFTDANQVLDASFKNPKMVISNMTNVIIPPAKDSRLKFGVYGGYGLTLNTSTSVVSSGVQIGAGLIYRF